MLFQCYHPIELFEVEGGDLEDRQRKKRDPSPELVKPKQESRFRQYIGE
jgi:hypothetical protein